jgi:hypothetical protein
MSMEMSNTRGVVRRAVMAVVIAAVFSLVSVKGEATPLDKLSGQSLTVGNLVFSNFSWPGFSGLGPSNIDVQGLVVTDPLTGMQQAGLRFVMIQSGAPAPVVMSAKGGAHEIVFQVSYSVTDTTGQLSTVTTSTIATAVGQSGVIQNTDVADLPTGNTFNPTLTYIYYCNWFGTLCENSTSTSPGAFAIVVSGNPTFTAPLFPGLRTYSVQHELQMQISNRKGTVAGTVTLQGWDVLFNE